MPADVARLAEKVPELTIVINHLANVDVDGGPPPKEWMAAMRRRRETRASVLQGLGARRTRETEVRRLESS